MILVDLAERKSLSPREIVVRFLLVVVPQSHFLAAFWARSSTVLVDESWAYSVPCEVNSAGCAASEAGRKCQAPASRFTCDWSNIECAGLLVSSRKQASNDYQWAAAAQERGSRVQEYSLQVPKNLNKQQNGGGDCWPTRQSKLVQVWSGIKQVEDMTLASKCSDERGG